MAFDFVDRSGMCAGCPLLDSRYIAGHGHRDTPVLVVGSAPGPEEEKAGRAFSGPSGKMVREILDSMGLNVYYTNVLKRRPSGKRPTKTECFRCGLHLIEEMKVNNVRLILALGTTPFDFLLGDRSLKVSTAHGLPIPLNRFGLDFRMTGTYDPGYITRQGGIHSKVGSSWLADLEDFHREAKKL